MSLLGQSSGYNKMRKEVKDKSINTSDIVFSDKFSKPAYKDQVADMNKDIWK